MDKRIQRNTAPHVAIVQVSVFIHRMAPDGSVDPNPVDCSDLFKDHSMAKTGSMNIKGFDKWDCVKKVREALDRMCEDGSMGK